MIEYEYTEGKHDVLVRVALDGRIVGEIRPVRLTNSPTQSLGWQYFPKGQRDGGEVFLTLGTCQRSLDSE